MKRNDYFEKAATLYDCGDINGEVYDAIYMNACEFCEEEEEEEEEAEFTAL